MKSISIIAVIFTCLAITTGVYGHGVGQSVEQTVGDYVIDVDYNSLSPEITAQTGVRFDIDISNADETEAPRFTDVWVTVTPSGSFEAVFAGNISRSQLGSTGFSFAFPKKGTYELAVRFQEGDKLLHKEVVFPLTVIEESTQKYPDDWYDIAIGTVVGVIVGFMIARLSSKTS